MMKTMHSEMDRRIIGERIRRLAPEAMPGWGKMNAPQMVVHLTDAVRMATGALPVKPKKSVVRFTPLKQLLLYVLPFPKGLPTARELITRAPAEWSGEVTALFSAIESFAARDPAKPWPDHPIFGAMSRRDWGVLAHRHFDHHLRQFGV